ncbi:MAG: SbcC/MukB-like Walker B domain-containing protein [Candidatus Xenobia bacterium]
MRLLSLQLCWFTRYRELSLDFDRDGLIGVVGQNGAGKSSLVDAIVWALYGKTRAGLAEVRHAGAPARKATSVELSFALDGAVWRVRRQLMGKAAVQKACLYKEPQKQPEAEGSDNVSLFISRKLHMTRKMFTRTFYAPQKDLEALAASTKDRRDQVEQLLGLGVIAAAEKAAALDSKHQCAELEMARQLLPDLASFTVRQAELIAQREVLDNKLEALSREETAWRAQSSALEGELQATERLRQQDQALGLELSRLQHEHDVQQRHLAKLVEIQQEMETARARLETIQPALLEGEEAVHQVKVLDGQRTQQESRKSIEQQVQQFTSALQPLDLQLAEWEVALQALPMTRQEAQARDADAEVCQRDHTSLQARHAEAGKQVLGAQTEWQTWQRLSTELGQRETVRDELKARLTSLSKALHEVHDMLSTRPQLEAQGAQLKAERQRLLDAQGRLRAELDRQAAEQRELTESLEEIERAGPNSACPFCRRPYQSDFPKVRKLIRQQLDALQLEREKRRSDSAELEQRFAQLQEAETAWEAAAQAVQKQVEHQHLLEGQQRELTRQLPAVEAEMQALTAQRDTLMDLLEELPDTTARLSKQLQQARDSEIELASQVKSAQQRAELARRAATQASRGLAKLQALEKPCADGRVRRESLATQLEGLTKKLTAMPVVPYDAKLHAQWKRRLADATKLRDEALHLEGRLQQDATLWVQLQEGQEAMLGALAQFEEKRLARVALSYDATVWEALQTRRLKLTTQHDELVESRGQLRERSATHEASQQALEAEREQAFQQQETVRNQAREQEHLEGLQRLLGAFREHQARQARPQLEQQASMLLEQMTDGRYPQLSLNDKYEVQVLDGTVSRRLEAMSGGENDLVHLCLRLAISRLMARNRGIDIQLLVLDEVLGSQDAERRAHIVRALHGLQAAFRQTLLITHVDEVAQGAVDHLLRVYEVSTGASDASFGDQKFSV